MKLYKPKQSVKWYYNRIKKATRKYLVKTGFVKRQEIFTVISLHRDNLDTIIGVRYSDSLSEEEMQDIACQMGETYNNGFDENDFLQRLEDAIKTFEMDREKELDRV